MIAAYAENRNTSHVTMEFRMEPTERGRALLQAPGKNRWHAATPFLQLGMVVLLMGATVGCPGDITEPVKPVEGDIVVKMATLQNINGWLGYEDYEDWVRVYRQMPGTTDDASIEELDHPRIVWQSSNTNVFIVLKNDNSRIRFVGLGTAVLTARLNDPLLTLKPGFDGTASTTITVSDPPTTIQLSPRGGTLLEYQALKIAITLLTARGVPAVPTNAAATRLTCDAADKCPRIEFNVSNGIIAISDSTYVIGQSFTIQALRQGTVVLTAALVRTTPAGVQEVMASDAITISVLHPARITVDPSSSSMFVGGTKQLSVSVFDASNKLISNRASQWTPSNSGLATVDTSGLVTAVSTGSGSPVSANVQINAHIDAGTMFATADITIYKQVTSVLVDPNPKAVPLGGTAQFTATFKDNNGNTIPPQATVVTWSVENTAFATIDQNGFLTATAAGTTRVVATTTEGVKGAADLSVVAPAAAPARVAVDPSAASIFVGGTKQLSATVFDAANNPIPNTVSWFTTDANLATVSGSGLVSAVSTGSGSTVSATVQIIARAAVGIEATASLTIYKQVANVLVEPNPKEMQVGSTHLFSATLKDNDGNTIPPQATVITWSVQNTSIATIDQSGLVTARGPGTTTVIATTAEGVRGVADLSVVVPPPSPVVRVVVTPASISLKLSDGKCQFTAKAFDVNGNEVVVPGFRWIVDVSPVASVDQNGLVTFKATGTTAVRAFFGDAADAPGGSGSLTITANP